MQSPPKKLLDQVRDVIRLKHYAHRTEETYVQWIRRYILFHNALCSELRFSKGDRFSLRRGGDVVENGLLTCGWHGGNGGLASHARGGSRCAVSSDRQNPNLSKTRVVLATASSVLEESEAMASGADAFLRKPFDLDQLLAIVEKLCNPKGRA